MALGTTYKFKVSFDFNLMIKVEIGVTDDGNFFGTWVDYDGRGLSFRKHNYIELLNYLDKLKEKYPELTLEPCNNSLAYRPLTPEKLAEIKAQL